MPKHVTFANMPAEEHSCLSEEEGPCLSKVQLSKLKEEHAKRVRETFQGLDLLSGTHAVVPRDGHVDEHIGAGAVPRDGHVDERMEGGVVPRIEARHVSNDDEQVQGNPTNAIVDQHLPTIKHAHNAGKQQLHEEKQCYRFLQTGKCRFGAECRFLHMTPPWLKHPDRFTKYDIDLFSAEDEAQVQRSALTDTLRIVQAKKRKEFDAQEKHERGSGVVYTRKSKGVGPGKGKRKKPKAKVLLSFGEDDS